jgi:hypothetical protein
MTKEEAIQKVLEELKAMPKEQLLAEIEKHKDGEWAKLLENSGAFDNFGEDDESD